MYVGLVVYGDLDNVSGGFRYDREVAARLRARGDEVEVVSLPWRSYPRHLADNLSPALDRRLDGPYDVLLQDELCHPSLVLPNRRLDCPVVTVVHSLRSAEPRPVVRRWLYRRVERQYLATVDGVVCNSRATRAAVRELAAAPTGELATVPTVVAPPGRGHRSPAVSAEEIADRARQSPLGVLFVGNVVPRKGLHVLVDGLARLPTGGWRLTAVGSLERDRSYVARVRRLIRDRGVGDRVTLTGRLSDESLDHHFRRHHLLAVPSLYEAFGIVYLEGMGYGLPALATTAGGADELVTDGEDGLLVPPGDPAAVAGTLEPLLDDRDRLSEMGVAARETYEAHPTWDETADGIRAFLGRLLEEQAAAPGA